MIERYEIKKLNGEEIIYIHCKFDAEFAKLNSRKKKKTLKRNIEEYIKKNKIKFLGKKAAIVVGGIVIGTILIASPINKEEQVTNAPPVIGIVETATPIEKIIPPEEEIKQAEEKVEIKEEKKDEVKEQTTTKTKTTTSVKKETKKPSRSSTSKKNTNTTVSKPATTEPKASVKEDKPVVEAPVQNQTMVTVYRSNGAILNLELEEYIVGVVAVEMPAAFHEQALMSQAIIARTYAINAINRGTKLTDNSSTQNYNDINELKKKWGTSFNTYYNKVKKAVDTTKGIYLTYNGQIIDAVYHSTSNGKTEASQNVWKNAFPYLVSVESPYDNSNKSYQAEIQMSYADLSAKLGIAVNKDTNIEILSKTVGDRVEKIKIAENIYTGVQIRTLLGLRSADFIFEQLENGVKITTKGYGHGVGLSQYGANGMAKNGATYSQILTHYYQGVTLSKK